MVLFMCLFMQKNYVRYKIVIEKTIGKKISLLKLSMYVSSNIKEIIILPDKLLKEIIMLHCCYDKRSDRINMTDLYQWGRLAITRALDKHAAPGSAFRDLNGPDGINKRNAPHATLADQSLCYDWCYPLLSHIF